MKLQKLLRLCILYPLQVGHFPNLIPFRFLDSPFLMIRNYVKIATSIEIDYSEDTFSPLKSQGFGSRYYLLLFSFFFNSMSIILTSALMTRAVSFPLLTEGVKRSDLFFGYFVW